MGPHPGGSTRVRQNIFGEPLPLPVASVDWTITDRLWLKSILPINAELTWLPIDALGLRASLLVSGNNYPGAESVYGVNNPQLNYSTAAADLGARWFILPFLHLTVQGTGWSCHWDEVFDLAGRRVETPLPVGWTPVGAHQVEFRPVGPRTGSTGRAVLPERVSR
jgi:hypothetical protein